MKILGSRPGRRALVLIVPMALAVLAGCWAIASVWSGALLQERILAVLSDINAQGQHGYKQSKAILTLRSYERGWFSSQAQLSISIPATPEPHEVAATLELSHGPWPLSALMHGHLWPRLFQASGSLLVGSGPIKEGLFEIYDSVPPAQLRVGCSYGNWCDFDALFPSAQKVLLLPHPLKLSFKGFRVFGARQIHSSDQFIGNFTVEILPFRVNDNPWGSAQLNVAISPTGPKLRLSWQTAHGSSFLSWALTLDRPDMIDEPSRWMFINFNAPLPSFVKSVKFDSRMPFAGLTDFLTLLSAFSKGDDPSKNRLFATMALDALALGFEKLGTTVKDNNGIFTIQGLLESNRTIINGKEFALNLPQLGTIFREKLTQGLRSQNPPDLPK